MSIPKSIIQRYEELISNISRLDKLYRIGTPEVDDSTYDKLYLELQNIENRYPDILSPLSPTQNLESANTYNTVEHLAPMLSISNTFNKEDIDKFIDRVKKSTNHPFKISVEYKLDGIAIAVFYNNGKLQHVSTRGNGYIGDIINIKEDTIASIPNTIKFKGQLEVYGELIISKQAFNNLNVSQELKGLSKFSNTRNLAAGSARLKDPQKIKERNLSSIFYGLYGIDCKTQQDIIYLLRHEGFETNNLLGVVESSDEIMTIIDKVESERDSMDYEIDGLVLKVFDIIQRSSMGFSQKTPKGITAYKLSSEIKKTRLIDIILQVGRTGIITPVAVLEPVSLVGATISRATLHNFAEIKSKDIRIGDYVFIERSGDVIPKIICVDFSMRESVSQEYQLPNKCPSCDSQLIKSENLKQISCTNSDCENSKLFKISYFASKNCTDIKFLGKMTIKKLLDEGVIGDIPDIYRLKQEDIEHLEGFGTVVSNKIIESIKESKSLPDYKILTGLGIPGFGEVFTRKILEHFKTINAIINAPLSSIALLPGIGDILAKKISSFFSKESTIRLINELHNLDVINIYKNITPSGGIIFSITGTFDESRSSIKNRIEKNGHILDTKISKKSKYLICGNNPGSKLEKAKEYNIPVISIENLDSII